MNIKFQDEKPIFLQVAEYLQDGILAQAYKVDEQIPSTTEISTRYKINPATALKGINLLVDEGVIYKKRGLGMFVAKGAREIILEKRKDEFSANYIATMLSEASKLGLSKEDIIDLVKKGNLK